MSEHLSSNPSKLSAIYNHMIAVMAGVTAGTMGVDQGDTVAKAGSVATRDVETDLRTRIFAHKIAGEAGRLAASAAAAE